MSADKTAPYFKYRKQRPCRKIENPYLQYFLGFKEYSGKPAFHPTLFVNFRKRLNSGMVTEINDAIVLREKPGKKRSKVEI